MTKNLPFAWDIVQRPNPWLENCDYPMRQVIIDGEVWIIHITNSDVYKSQCQVARYKGLDLEHLVRQPDGFAADMSGASAFICGLWWDAETRTLYGLIHSEYGGWRNQGWCSKKTRLAVSHDIGLSWTLGGDILTRYLPEVNDYSGNYFEAGPGDFDFYADEKGGYFYVTSLTAFVPKYGRINGFVIHSEVARCAITDKMAPGKWWKFRDGGWGEPGLGGRPSRLGFNQRGVYGNTIYSTYLQRYLRIGTHGGVEDGRGMPGFGYKDHSVYITACTDLGKQDWLPMGKLIPEADNPLFGFTLTDSAGRDPVTCDQHLRIYNYWQNAGPGRVLNVTLKPGTSPSAYFPPYDNYEYEPHPESAEPLESRRTRILGNRDSGVNFQGEWIFDPNLYFYQGFALTAVGGGASLEFHFSGTGIYWRAAASPDGGKADVFIDGKLVETVDTWFCECLVPYQFAFVKTDLEAGDHAIIIVVRGDWNPNSSGTKIRHIAFEVSDMSFS